MSIATNSTPRALVHIPESVFLHRGPENESIVEVLGVDRRGYDVRGPDGRTYRVSGNCLGPASPTHGTERPRPVRRAAK